ncbi:MAG: exonuclease SbcCD subunit D [Methanococci archaeon]|nr:exonuclease SbcCD subunit D [Methanococci archaeon]
MLFAHIADNHLGYRQYNLYDREKDIYDAFKECINQILEIKPDVVLHCGDLFNDIRPPVRALKVAMQGFKKLKEKGIKVYIVAGNHETPRRESEDTPLSLFRDYVHVLNGYDVIDGEIFLCGTRFHRKSKREKILEKLKEFEVKAKSYNKRILMLHQGINPYLPYDYEIELFDLPKFNYYALGHVHSRILERVNDGILAYSGSTEIIYRNEYENYKKEGKGFYLVDYSKKELDLSDIEKINIECREFVEVNIKDEKSLNEAINTIKKCKDKPVVYGKIKKEFKPLFDLISNKILINKVILVDDGFVEINDDLDIEAIDIKKTLIEYANKQGVDGNLVLELYKCLLTNDDWKHLLQNYYNSKFRG